MRMIDQFLHGNIALIPSLEHRQNGMIQFFSVTLLCRQRNILIDRFATLQQIWI